MAHKIEQNGLFLKASSTLAEKDEDDEEKKKEKDKKAKDFPQENIEKMLKSISLTACIPKLKEQEIAEPDVFFELSEDTLISALGIETEGKKWRFKEKMKEIKEKHEKAKAKKEQEEQAEAAGETFEAI